MHSAKWGSGWSVHEVQYVRAERQNISLPVANLNSSCVGRLSLTCAVSNLGKPFPPQPPQDLSRKEEELSSSDRRHSAGDVLDSKAPVKHKPPPSPNSRSTSTSPLLDRGRKTEGGGVTKRAASPLGISRKENSSSVGAVKREASPTSSGESEASSASETLTPSSTAKACTVGEKVSEQLLDHMIMALGSCVGCWDHVIMVVT